MNIQYNIQLQPFNSFRTKALARLFSEPSSVEELSEILKAYPNEKKMVLGAGYNLLFTCDFDGMVIKPAMRGMQLINENAEFVEIEAGAAEPWDPFIGQSVAMGYAGLENLSLIPSSVGASPVHNIGAYGTEVKDTIIKVKAVNIHSSEPCEFTNEECASGYRDSIFKRTRAYIITSVVFRLSKSFIYKEKYIDLSRELEGIATPTLTQVRDAIIRIRTRKLPNFNLFPNAGSFFKNPILSGEEKDALLKTLADAPIYPVGENRFKTSAAFLIEKAGFKGKRRGMVGTYEHHALIIVNYGTENGREIVDFMQEIQSEVKKLFGIMLEPEVNIF